MWPQGPRPPLLGHLGSPCHVCLVLSPFCHPWVGKSTGLQSFLPSLPVPVRIACPLHTAGTAPSENSHLTNLTSLPRASRDTQRDRHTQNNSHSLLPASPPGTWPTDSLVDFMPVTVAPHCPQNDPVQPPWGLCLLCLPGMFFSSDPTAIPTMAHSFTFLKNNFIHLYFGCTGSSLLPAAYSLVMVLGLLIPAASLVSEHQL